MMFKTIIKKIVLKNRMLSQFCKLIFLPPDKDFNSRHYWDNRYESGGNSGLGSYGKIANFKAMIINNFIKKNPIESVLEFGCGDGNQLSLLKIQKYIGFDVSKKSIEICKNKFSSDNKKSFFLYDSNYFIDNLNIFNVDLTLSLDVIYHLIEDEVYEKYMNDLFSYSKKYVIIYASNTNNQGKVRAKHVFQRQFSDFVEKNYPYWKLVKKIKNKYPEKTFAEFFIYQKMK